KRAVVIVVIQTVLAVIRHINVRPTVVVVISHGHAKSPSFICHTGLVRYIGECSIMIVVKEHRTRRALFAKKRRNSRTIQNVDVEPAVIVVIEQRHTRTRRFNNRRFFRAAGLVFEFREPGLLRDIRENNWSAIDKSTRCDGPRFFVFNSRVRDSRGNARGWRLFFSFSRISGLRRRRAIKPKDTGEECAGQFPKLPLSQNRKRGSLHFGESFALPSAAGSST